ncbi:MAG: 2-acylglycerophosphoethanolamine acyltransferase [Salinibacterium sp.]|nr:MAG: 2-acylglycerophosphoethanolamine acyltransferase [Salinibacterium sp.]
MLLPNSVAAVATFFALHAHGRVPAMLNFSTGLGNMKLALRAARISAVVTSRRFVEAARLEDVVKGLSEAAEIVYLEDVRQRIGVLSKLYGLITTRLARFGFRRAAAGAKSGDPAAILFTSGSEGVPKGVALSHRNIQANRHQLSARIDFNPTDIVFNALPIFHSFGLTGGLLLPLLSGVRTFLYPSPLHYRIVPALVYDTDATILFGTDTFLSGYARAAHPYDFYSVRYIFAGAEKLKAETSRAFAEKFGLRILEGYGATETAPVIAVNTPMQHRSGTVGRLLPGLRHRLAAVPGIERGGRLEVAGSNVMLGYLRPDRPGEIAPLDQGWYDTGDIVEIDSEGYVTIVGRAKRFAKVGGEMISLAAVEDKAAELWPGRCHAVVAAADARKGERLVLVTDFAAADRDVLLAHIRRGGGTELMAPKDILVVDKLPLLGTGKVDYTGVKALVEGRIAAPAP